MSPSPLRRNIGLVGIGLSLQSISAFANGRQLRIPGVLQRLGLASIIANEPQLSILQQYDGLPLALLWYGITLLGSNNNNPLAHPDYPSADPSETAQTKIDKFLFGERLHTPFYDPEGLLGSLTTAISFLIGRSFAHSTLSRSQKLLKSVGMIALGETFHYILPKYAPISKSLWTPSFVLVTSGTSILKYLAVEVLIPYIPETIQSLLEVVGKRPLEVYVVSTLLTMILKYGGEQSLFSRATRFSGKEFGRAMPDLVVSLGVVGTVAACAKSMVSHHIRLQW